MTLPDPTITPAVYWHELTKGRPHRVVDFPRKNPETGEPIAKLAIVVLTRGESITCSLEAEKQTRKLLQDSIAKKDEASRGYDEAQEKVLADQVLFACCKDLDDPTLKRPFFRTPREIGQHLSDDECTVLIQQYVWTRATLGPVLQDFESDEELESWVMTLVKGGLLDPLVSAAHAILMRSVIILGKRLASLQAASNSPGTPQDSGGSSPEKTPETGSQSPSDSQLSPAG